MDAPVAPEHGDAPFDPTDGWVKRIIGLNDKQKLYLAKKYYKDAKYKLDLSEYNREKRNAAAQKPSYKKTIKEVVLDTYHGIRKSIFGSLKDKFERKLNITPTTKENLNTREELEEELAAAQPQPQQQQYHQQQQDQQQQHPHQQPQQYQNQQQQQQNQPAIKDY